MLEASVTLWCWKPHYVRSQFDPVVSGLEWNLMWSLVQVLDNIIKCCLVLMET